MLEALEPLSQLAFQPLAQLIVHRLVAPLTPREDDVDEVGNGNRGKRIFHSQLLTLTNLQVSLCPSR